MIAGGDERALAEAAAAATTASLSPDDDPALLRLFGVEGPAREIRELESRAASFRDTANQFTQAANRMRAYYNQVNGNITQEDIEKTKTYATAGGFRSEAYRNSPPHVKVEVDRLESRANPYNWGHAIKLAAAGVQGGEQGARQGWYQIEINRAGMIARILNQKAREAQAQADLLRAKMAGSQL
jgi:hypothetical protein